MNASGEGALRILDVVDGIATADMLGEEFDLGGHVSAMRIRDGIVGGRLVYTSILVWSEIPKAWVGITFVKTRHVARHGEQLAITGCWLVTCSPDAGPSSVAIPYVDYLERLLVIGRTSGIAVADEDREGDDC